MADRRIAIDRSLETFVVRLQNRDDGIGPFALKVDVLAFAASYGSLLGHSSKLGDITKSPIRLDVFDAQNYSNLFYLLAVRKTGDVRVLDSTDEAQDRRATIFEEYAKAGLERMQSDFRGAVDYTNSIISLVLKHRPKTATGNDGQILGLDLSDLIDESV